MRRFEFTGGSSEKFWEVERSGSSVTVRFGRIGTNGQTKVKDLDDEAAAQAHLDGLVAAKVRKGYVAVADAAEPAAARASAATTPPASKASTAVDAVAAVAPASEPPDAGTAAAPAAVDAAAPAAGHGAGETAPAAALAAAPVDAEVPVWVDEDEDTFVVPSSWRRRVHPIRDLDRFTPVRPEPDAAAAAAAMVAEQAEVVSRVLAHPGTDRDLAEAAKRYLGTGGGLLRRAVQEDDPTGGAVVARILAFGVSWRRRSELTALVDDWFVRLGPAWTTEACARLGELGWNLPAAPAHHRPGAINGLTRLPPDRDVQLHSTWPMLERLRRLLASLDDTAYAEVLVRVAPLRSAHLGTRAVLTYLTPSERGHIAADLASTTGAQRDIDDCYLYSVTDLADATILLERTSPWHLTYEADRVTTIAVHVGPAIGPLLATHLDGVDGADGRKLLAGMLVQLPTDEAFSALVNRADQKYVGPLLLEAQRRYPRRAARLLAGVAAEGAGPRSRDAANALRSHLATHPGLPERIRPELSPAAAAVLDEVAVAEASVVRARPDQIPAILATPPWTTRPKATKPRVIGTIGPPPPATLTWVPGEREAWAALDAGYSWIVRGGKSWSQALTELLEGKQQYRELTILAMAPPDEVALVLYDVVPHDLWDGETALRRLLANLGELALPWVIERVRSKSTQLADVLLPVEGGEVAALMAEWLRRSKSLRPLARAWFERHPEAAARDLLAPALGKAGVARTAAEEALRFLASQGHAGVVRAQAAALGPEVSEAIEVALATDPLHLLPARLPALPAWLEPAALPPLLLADRSAALPSEAAGELVMMLALSKPGEPYAGIEVVRPELDPASLAEFGWAAFERWRSAGQPSKEAWVLDGLALVGDDETVRRLAPVIRAWPGESAHARAVSGLDVLAAIGTDVALMHLHGISEKVKFKGLKTKAAEKIGEVAEGLGLSTDQLADRLVPDLGLDDDGSLVLDYGPRSFRVGFDEQLKPVIYDTDGTRRKTLPKPGAKDDDTVADPAYARFAGLKKDVRTIAADQIRRFEAAMVAQRRWPATELRSFFVDHPLLWHLSRRLVWATFDADGVATGSFRVAEDRTLADVEDREIPLADDTVVGVAHPLHLGDAVGPWSDVFADYEILQPFAQLGREVLALTDAERSAKVLDRLAGTTVATGKVLGLTHRAWERGMPQDAGIVGVTFKAMAGNRHAVIDLDPGIVAGDATYFAEQTLGTVWLTDGPPDWGNPKGDRPFSDLDPISASELLRDLDHLKG